MSPGSGYGGLGLLELVSWMALRRSFKIRCSSPNSESLYRYVALSVSSYISLYGPIYPHMVISYLKHQF